MSTKPFDCHSMASSLAGVSRAPSANFMPLQRPSRWCRLAPVLTLVLLAAACVPQSGVNVPVDYRDGSNRERALPAGGTYTVQRGDTIYGVARQANVSVRALIDANNLQAPFQLAVGQVLVLPYGGDYVVVKDDTLMAVSRKTGVPVSTLARMNNLSAPYVLKVGQRLKMPTSGGEGEAVASTSQAPQVIDSPQMVQAVTPTALPPPVAAPQPLSDKSYSTVAEREGNTVGAAIPPPPPPPPPPSSGPAQPAAVAQAAPGVQSAAPPAAEQKMAAATSTPNAPLPPPPANSGHGFVWPLHGQVIAEFGTTGKGQHNDGINIAVPLGTPVVAAQDGIVAYSGNELRGFGNLLLIKHADGWMTAYAHNDKLLVKRGETVHRGQQIAKAGDSGGVGQPQLHFEIRQGTRAVDPMSFLGGKTTPVSSPSDQPGPG